MTEAENILAAVMRNRTNKALRLEWFIPSENRRFTAYAKDEAQKQAWIAKGEARGWVVRKD